VPTPISIDSLDDPRVSLYRDVRDRFLRGEHDCFVAESVKVVERLLASRFQPASLLLEDGVAVRLAGALDAIDPTVPVYTAAPTLLRGIAGYHVHRGALAIVRRPDRQTLSWHGVVDGLRGSGDESWTLLAANGVTHMDNIGALFRNGAALDVGGILLDDRCCDPLLRKPIRVAMGHSLHLPFGWCDRLSTILPRLRDEHGAMIVALEGHDHPALATTRVQPIEELPADPKLVLVVGSEGHGIDGDILAICDRVVEIPMRQGVPSLNLATAAAIALDQRRRCRPLRHSRRG